MYDNDDENAMRMNENTKWPVFDPTVKWDHQEPSVGMVFEDSKQLRHYIINYAVANGREIRFKKMAKNFVWARCKEGCKWRVYATINTYDNNLQVKTYHPHHHKRLCALNFNVKLATASWLAVDYASDIKDDPKWKLDEFQFEVQKRHRIKVSILQCHRAKVLALSEVEQLLKEHYARVWDYREELLRSNPGSTIVVTSANEMDSMGPQFGRMYICFDALKKGRLAGCRPVIGLDGCFLKSYAKGQLLCAVGRDGNNHMFPIAWAVVDTESTDTWCWFLRLLNDDIGFDEGEGLTFISDQQKGLMNALAAIFPYAEHRNCARHIYANFRKRYPRVQLRNPFWEAARSSTSAEFLTVMDNIKKVSQSAYDYLMANNPNSWCRGYFATTSCCDFNYKKHHL